MGDAKDGDLDWDDDKYAPGDVGFRGSQPNKVSKQ